MPTGMLKRWDNVQQDWVALIVQGPEGPQGPAGPEGPQGPAVDETVQVIADSGTALDLDLSQATAFDVTLTANCTLNFVNPGTRVSFALFLRQDATGGRTATWPAIVQWPEDGVEPVLTPTANAVDGFSLISLDGGATFLAGVAGQDYA